MKRNAYNIRKAFKRYLFATILSNVAFTLGIVVDGIIVGNFLGPNALSSINLTNPLVQLYTSLFLLVNVGGSILAAMAIGKRKLEEANNIFSYSIVLNAFLGILISILGIFFSHQIASFFCSDTQLTDSVYEYMKVVLWTAPVYFFLPGIATFVSTDNNPALASLGLIIANIINLLLDLVFIKGLGLGLMGSSLATSIGYFVGIMVVLTHFRKGKGMLKWSFNPDFSRLKGILIMGFPLFLTSICVMVQLFCVNYIVLDSLGVTGMSILAVCMNILMVSTMFINGSTEAMQPVAGILYGAEDYKGVKMAIYTALKFLIISLVGFTILVEIVPSVMAHLFGLNDPSVLNAFNRAFRIFVLCIPLYGVNYLMMAIYQLTKRNIYATIIPIAQMFCILGTMLLFVFTSNTDMLWFAFFTGESVVIILILIISFFTRRKHKGLTPLILIQDNPQDAVLLDFSVDNKESSMNEANSKIVEFVRNQNLKSGTGNFICLCFEELIQNIFHHAFTDNKKHFIDVNLRVYSDKVILSIKDDGLIFDPFSYDKKTGIGLMIVKGSCKDVNYARIMNQNVATLIFPLR